MFNSLIAVAAFAFSLTAVIYFVAAVVIGLILCYCVGLFIPDAKIMQVIRLLIGIIVLCVGLSLFHLIPLGQ